MLCSICQKNQAQLVLSFHAFDSDYYFNTKKYEETQKLCFECYLKESLKEHIQCFCCQLYYINNDELFYECNNCMQNICSINCIAITGCQTRYCVCRKCFDGKCIDCDESIDILPEGKVYLWDEKPVPKCDNCQS
jgi:hypothetical protein